MPLLSALLVYTGPQPVKSYSRVFMGILRVWVSKETSQFFTDVCILWSHFRGEPHCSQPFFLHSVAKLWSMPSALSPGVPMVTNPWDDTAYPVSTVTQKCTVFFLQNASPQLSHASFTAEFSMSTANAYPIPAPAQSLWVHQWTCVTFLHTEDCMYVCGWGKDHSGTLSGPYLQEILLGTREAPKLVRLLHWFLILYFFLGMVELSLCPCTLSLYSQGGICNIADKQEVHPEVPSTGDTDAGWQQTFQPQLLCQPGRAQEVKP